MALILQAVSNPGAAFFGTVDGTEIEIDPTGLTYVTSIDVQGAIGDLDAVIQKSDPHLEALTHSFGPSPAPGI